MTAAQIIARYDLQPLPGEGGYFRRFYTHPRQLPGSASRLASVIFFLITKDSFSAMHRLPSDELFHFYEGHPTQMLQLDPTGGGQIFRLSPDHERAVVVPGGVWQGMRLMTPSPFLASAFIQNFATRNSNSASAPPFARHIRRGIAKSNA